MKAGAMNGPGLIDFLCLPFKLFPESCKPYQSGAQKEHGGGFRDRGNGVQRDPCTIVWTRSGISEMRIEIKSNVTAWVCTHKRHVVLTGTIYLVIASMKIQKGGAV